MQVRVISTSCRQGFISAVAEVSDPEVIELNSVTICSIKPMFSTLKVSVSLKSLGRPKRDFIAATFFESKLEKIRKLDYTEQSCNLLLSLIDRPVGSIYP